MLSKLLSCTYRRANFPRSLGSGFSRALSTNNENQGKEDKASSQNAAAEVKNGL